MSTRSYIAAREGNQYRAVYCHFDGYPKGVGKTLQEHYTDPAKVSALLDLGSISVLAPRLAPNEGEPHDLVHPVKDVTTAYGRDRGEDNTEAGVYADLPSLWKGAGDSWAEFTYVFEDARWHLIKEGILIPVEDYREEDEE